MWKEIPRTRKKEVLSSHHVESSRPSLTTVSLHIKISYAASRFRKIKEDFHEFKWLFQENSDEVIQGEGQSEEDYSGAIEG